MDELIFRATEDVPERKVNTSVKDTYMYQYNYFINCQTFTFNGAEDTWARVNITKNFYCE